MGSLVTCRVLFVRAPVLGLCFFVSVKIEPLPYSSNEESDLKVPCTPK